MLMKCIQHMEKKKEIEIILMSWLKIPFKIECQL
jgi:hypothetical protein